jgi:hypothetical protein
MAASVASTTCCHGTKPPTGSARGAGASPRGRAPTASSNFHRLSSSTGLRIWSRRRGSTGIGQPEAGVAVEPNLGFGSDRQRWIGSSSEPPRSGRIQPDRSWMLLLMIRPARPSLAEVPLADLSFPTLLGLTPWQAAGPVSGKAWQASGCF